MTAPRYPRPELLRRLAGQRHAVIEASAGTGKTYTLEHVVVELLLGNPVLGTPALGTPALGTPALTISELLIVTFTEKATSELRARIRKLLVTLLELPVGANSTLPDAEAWVLDEPARARLERALRELDLATISTIHAFCHGVLVENAFAAGAQFDLAVADRATMFRRIFLDLLREEFARGGVSRELLAAWLGGGRDLDALAKLLGQCASERGELVPLVDDVREQLAHAAAAPEVTPARRGLLAAALAAANVLKPTADGLTTWLDELAERLAGATRPAATLTDRIAVAEFVGRRSPRKYLKVEYPSHLAQLCAVLDAVVLPADPSFARLKLALEELRVTAVLLAPRIVQRFTPLCRTRLDAHKRAEGLLDFDAMITEFDRALADPDHGPTLCASLQARYRFALVDEFQDTDELQWQSFRRLFADPTAPGGLYVIGDPKQAIYSFRGADVATYLDARHLLERIGVRETLEENFRSSAPLLSALNELFHDRADYFAGSQIRYDRPVRACSTPPRLVGPDGVEPRPVQVLPLASGSVGKVIAVGGLGRCIAREIRALTARAAPYLFTERGTTRPLTHKDVYVIGRTRGELKVVASALRAAAVPCAFYKLGGLFESEAAYAVAELLGAIADPGDPAQRIRALLTDFFAFSLEEALYARDLEPDHPLIQRLHAWHEEAAHQRYPRLFSSILEESGFARRAILLGQERELTNVLHLFEWLGEQAARAPTDPRGLVRALADARQAGEGDEGNAQLHRLETDRDCVQLMTMHAAKGLEAAVVFVVGGLTVVDWGGPYIHHAGSRRRAWIGDAMPDDVSASVEAEAEAEGRRLLYVALTRAKVLLYLPLVLPDEKGKLPGKFNGPYRAVNQRLQALLDGENPAALPGFEVRAAVDASVTSAGTPPVPVVTLPASLLVDAQADPLLLRLGRERGGELVTSFSRLGRRAVVALHPEAGEELGEVGDERAAPEPGPDELPKGRVPGTFVHAVIERMPVAALDRDLAAFRARPDAARILVDEARRHGIAERYLPDAARLVHVALAARVPLGAGREIHGIGWARRLHRELEFLYPIPERSHPRLGDAKVPGVRLELERGFLRGFIDVMFEHEGRAYVGDWKTNSLDSYEPDKVRAYSERVYGLQARIYTVALVRLLRVGGARDYADRFGGTLFLYLRGLSGDRGLHFARPSWDEVRDWEQELVGLDYGGAA